MIKWTDLTSGVISNNVIMKSVSSSLISNNVIMKSVSTSRTTGVDVLEVYVGFCSTNWVYER